MTERKPLTAVGTVRAAPRKAKKATTEAAVFIKNTFDMVNSAVGDIACWSDTGDTFLVKDEKRFQAELLPRFFKHNNFRSFVRQLNFYGFRKLRTDGALIAPRPKHWCEFRHEKFLRGRPDLLVQIKRANHYESESGQTELVEELKGQVNALTARVDDMASTIEHLTGLVDALLKERNDPGSQTKKRRVSNLLAQPHTSIKAEGAVSGAPAQTPTPTTTTTSPLCDDFAEGSELLKQLSLDSSAMHSDVGFITGLDDADLDPLASFSTADWFSGTGGSGTGEDVSGAVADAQNCAADAARGVGPGLPVTAAGLPSPAPASHHHTKMEEDAPVEMPPVAPYLATAAIGAFFTTLASQQQGAAPPTAMPTDGAPLMRTMSQTGIVVQT